MCENYIKIINDSVKLLDEKDAEIKRLKGGLTMAWGQCKNCGAEMVREEAPDHPGKTVIICPSCRDAAHQNLRNLLSKPSETEMAARILDSHDMLEEAEKLRGIAKRCQCCECTRR